MNCSNCGRSGVQKTQLAYVFREDGGGLERRRCCRDCIGSAVLIVSRPASTSATGELLTPQEVATRTVLRALARHLRRMAKAYRAVLPGQLAIDGQLSHDAFRVAGLETAADMADGWAARPEARVDIWNDAEDA